MNFQQHIIPLSAPAGRVLLTAIFLLSGITKVTSYAQTQGYMEAMGVPGALLPLVIVTEVALSLMIIAGWKTRIAAFLLAGFSLLSALLFHADFADQNQMTHFLKNVGLAGGFLILLAQGAGAYALDNSLKNALDNATSK